MAIIKCKMCGGDLVIQPGSTIAVCEYCGTKQTLPKLDDERKVHLYDRANYFRRGNDFDKAMGIYEMILGDDKEDPEAYWGIVLCRHGIEYVEDPRTHKRIPTVNRAQYSSIFEDEDYKKAISFADAGQKAIYEEEAAVIDRIQRGILEISSREEPFDIFICYKETDDHGNRTKDSVYAQEIYDALTKEGYKVFFSRITLEDKLGSAYEPYIFAALNSARVMLVVGTAKENFDAVWVKNEWSRYLSLIQAGKEKTLIPVYKSISPYEMPEEFQYLQSQDMGKVGFLQDLIRGVKKIIDVGAVTVTQTVGTTSVIVETMLKRASAAIEAGDWEKASRCYDNVLDYDDKNEQAFVGRILIDFQAKTLEELENGGRPLSGNKNYQYLLEHGRRETAAKMQGIEERIEKKIREKAESEAKRRKAKTARITKTVLCAVAAVIVIAAAGLFTKNFLIPNSAYQKAVAMVEDGRYDEAVSAFRELGDFKDSSAKIYETYLRKAEALAGSGSYPEAMEVLEQTGLLDMNYRDSEQLYLDSIYQMARQAYDSNDYQSAIKGFEEAAGYADADRYLADSKYALAEQVYEQGNYDDAISAFQKVGDYEDAAQRAAQISYEAAEASYADGNYDKAISYFRSLGDYEDAAQRAEALTYEAGVNSLQNERYTDAVGYFKGIPEYEDASAKLLEAKYRYCSATKDNPTDTTKSYIRDLQKENYADAESMAKVIFAWKAEMRIWVSLRLGTQTGVSFDAKLSGGDGGSTKVKFVIYVDGQRMEYCDEKLYSAGDTASCQLSNSMQDITKKTFTVNVYDSNGASIGTITGVPED